MSESSSSQNRRVWLAAAGFMSVVCVAAQGCVRAEVAVVSQHTALERQAAGEYPEGEQRLDNAAIEPGPEAIPREALAATGEGGQLGVVAQLVARAETDDERIEALLEARCLGEGEDGLLAPRPDDCRIDVDPDEVGRLSARENLHRRQVWEFLAEQSPGRTTDEARVAWRELHLMRVPCGALVELRAGSWTEKECQR